MLAPPLKNALLRFRSKPGSLSVKTLEFSRIVYPVFWVNGFSWQTTTQPELTTCALLFHYFKPISPLNC
jgi:hypothetical protein